MTADTPTLALVSAKLDLVIARLDELTHSGKPGLTQAEFAKLIHKHPATVKRWVARKLIRLEKGVIPHSEVRKYLS